MKKLLAILILLIMMLPSLVRFWVLIDFELKREVIATTLCINKDKPITVCGGSCYLSNQLEKTQEPAPQQLPQSLKVKIDLNYYWTESPEEPTTITESTLSTQLAYDELIYHSAYLDDIFRPPQFS